MQSDGKFPVRILDTATGKEVDMYPHLRDKPVGGVSADGSRRISNDDRRYKFFDVATGKQIGEIDAGKSRCSATTAAFC